MEADLLVQILEELRDIKAELRWFRECEDRKHQSYPKGNGEGGWRAG